jgi:pimeloyl-ACP methyl ester carboxylesterase
MARFSGGRETLFGILTAPTGAAAGTWVALVPGGSGNLDSINRNRLWVRVARQLASIGCHAFRFDYHGAGESTGTAERLRLDRPFTDDLAGAVQFVQARGAEKIVLVGSCFGARTALAGARDVADLRGVVLIAPYVRNLTHAERVAEGMASGWSMRQYMRRVLRVRTIRGMLNRDRRTVYRTVLRAKVRGQSGSPNTDDAIFVEPLAELVDRRVPTLLVFGDSDDPTSIEFAQAREGRLAEILERAGDLIEIRSLPGKVHGLRTLAVQDSVTDLVSEWLLRQGLAAR